MFRILLLIALLIFEVNTVIAQQKIIVVSGSVTLENQTDHSGITIAFDKKIPDKKEYEFHPDTSGNYSFEIEEGIYDISFFMDSYEPEYLEDVNLFNDKNLGQIVLEYLGVYLTGEISGTIQSGVYEVRDTLIVKKGEALVIEKGTVLRFHEDALFSIAGDFKAIGTANNGILFTSVGPDKEWSGMKFEDSFYQSDSLFAVMDYVTIEKATKIGLDIGEHRFIDFNHLTYQFNNRMAIGPGGVRGTLKNSIIRNNKGKYTGGIRIMSSYILVENTIISNNESEFNMNTIEGMSAGGVSFYQSYSTFRNVLIYGNKSVNGGGMNIGTTQDKFINCVIADNIAYKNGPGLYYYYGTSVEFINCIIADNNTIYNNETLTDDYQIVADKKDLPIHPSLRNCIVYHENGMIWNDPADYFGENIRTNFSNDSTDAFGNLFLDPYFSDSGNNDYSLSSQSPGIDAGINIEDLSEIDFLENIRIWDGNYDNLAIVDIGAYEFDAPPFSAIEQISLDDFESSNIGVTIYDQNDDNNSFVRTDLDSYSGDYSLLINNDNGESDDWLMLNNIATQKGNIYYLSFWLKLESVNFDPEIDKLNLHFSPNGNDVLSGDYQILSIDIIDNDWQKILIELDVEDSKNAIFAISVELQSNIRIFFDDIALEVNNLSSNEQPVESSGILLYPNPSNGSIMIKTIDRGIISSGRIEIYKTTGELIRNVEYKNNFHVFSNLPIGSYYCRISSGRKVYLEKFIVTK